MGRPGKLTVSQEKEVLERAAAGETWASLAAAYGVSKAAITRVKQRAEIRAAAEPPTQHTDPETGIEVDITDDCLLGQVTRTLAREFHKKGMELEDLISIAHVLPKLATARHRIRQPAPGVKPAQAGAASPPAAEPAVPLVRFN